MGDKKKFGGFLELSVRNQRQQFMDGSVQWAGFDAGRIRTLDAAAGLLAGGGFVVGAGGFTEIGNPVGSRTFRRLRAVNFTPDRKSTRLNSSHLGISYAVF